MIALAFFGLLAADTSVADLRAAHVDPAALAGDLLSGLAVGHRGFPAGAALAVSLDAPDRFPDGWKDALLGALGLGLEALGARTVRPLPLEPRGTGPSPIEQATALGAEWLVAVSVLVAGDGLAALARLEEVDRGLWEEVVAPGRVHATASARRDLPPLFAEARPGQEHDARGPRGFIDGGASAGGGLVLGAPTSLLPWPERVWALALCPTPADGERLIILDRKRLTVLDLRGVRARVTAVLPLSRLPPAAAPVRAPFGNVRCGAPGIAAFGHGRLAKGAEIDFVGEPPTARAPGAAYGLRIRRLLPGFPVGASATGWWLAAPFEGRRVLGPTLIGPSGERAELEAPLLELAILPDGERFGVDETLTLRPLTETFTFGLSLGRAGAGLGARRIEGRSCLATTGEDPREERLRVACGREVGERKLPAPAVAVALGHPRGTTPAALIALSSDASGSMLVLVPLSRRAQAGAGPPSQGRPP